MNPTRASAALLLLIILLPLNSHGQVLRPAATTGPVDITAMELRHDRALNTYTAEGDVEVREGTRQLTADFVLFNDTTKEAFAEGHVIFRDQEDTIEAEKMSYNLVTERGTIEKGKVFVKSGNFYLSGNEIEKTGESTYAVRQGEFTTCGWDHPAWTFAAKDVELTVGGYATAKHNTFSILGHKVLYLPWGVFPVKTERQSGFLLPQFQSSSRDGAVIRSAYYWAIAKDKDATFFLDWIQQRGIQPGTEFRYALTESTKGSWYGSIIDDTKFGHTRYQMRGEHEQVFFGDMSFKAEINHASDFDYLKDLGKTTVERSQNSLRSVAFIEKPFTRSLLTAESAYFDDLTRKDPGTTFRYLPSVSYFTEYLPVLRGRVYADASTELTNFSRDQGDKFTRLSVEPALRLPYSLNGLNFLFSGSVIEKSYLLNQSSPNDNNTSHYEAFRVEGDVNAQFLKNSSTDLFGLGQFQSTVMPRMRYTFIRNNTSFEDIPSIDPSDRINDANTITYSLSHYLNANMDGQLREISLMEIEQTYGLSGDLEAQPFLYEGSGNRLSDVHTRFTLFPHANFSYVHEDVINFYGDGLRIVRNSVHYAVPPIFQADLSHTYTKNPVINQGAISTLGGTAATVNQGGITTLAGTAATVNQLWLNTLGRWRSFDLNYQIAYSFEDNSWIDTLTALTYHPTCWSVTLTLAQTRRPRDTSIHFSFNLQGITQKLGGY